MTLQKWSPKFTSKLISLFEQSHQVHFNSDGQRILGIAAWDLNKALRGFPKVQFESWLKLTGYAGYIELEMEDETVYVDVDEAADPWQVMYREPDSFKKRVVPLSATEVEQVDETAFLHRVADLFHIPQVLRSGITSPELQNSLWCLGEAVLDHGYRTEIWVARNLSVNWPQLVRAVSGKGKRGILLTTSNTDPSMLPSLDGFSICRLNDFIVQGQSNTVIDKELLYRYQAVRDFASEDKALPLRYDHHQRRLTITGKEPWILKGDKQAKAVLYMYEQAQNDRWELPAKEILLAANGSTSGARRMSSLFSNNGQWDQYIVSQRRGYYRFSL